MKSISKIFIVCLVILIEFFFLEGKATEFDYPTFIRRCGWGTVIGTGLGVVSLAFENHPFDHGGNVSKGASLGLYGGMVYGLVVSAGENKIPLDHTPLDLSPESSYYFFNYDHSNSKTEFHWVYQF